tara:strand:+ start:16213 stop:16728 length:516 start_codon:yes stop_codon:yes gene_type:complete
MSNSLEKWLKESKEALERLDHIKLNCSGAIFNSARNNASVALAKSIENQMNILESLYEKGRCLEGRLPSIVFGKAVSDKIESHLSGRKVFYSTERNAYDLRMGLLKRIVEQDYVVLFVSGESDGKHDKEFFDWAVKNLNTKVDYKYDPNGPWSVAKDNSDRMCVVYRRSRD